jgi:hypothetical protein
MEKRTPESLKKAKTYPKIYRVFCNVLRDFKNS